MAEPCSLCNRRPALTHCPALGAVGVLAGPWKEPQEAEGPGVSGQWMKLCVCVLGG